MPAPTLKAPGPSPHTVYLEAHPEERERLRAFCLDRTEEDLARVLKELAGGVYLTGPRRGKPYLPRYRRQKEEHAEQLRESLAQLRGTRGAVHVQC